MKKVFSFFMSVVGIIITILSLYPIYYVIIASVSKPFFVENGDVMFWIKGFNFRELSTSICKRRNMVSLSKYILLYNCRCYGKYVFLQQQWHMLYQNNASCSVSFFTIMTVFTMWFNAGMIPLYMTFV